MATAQPQINFVHGPAKRPEWAQMIRLGGDRVAILFEELRKSVAKVDGIVERLRYSGRERCWVVQYELSGVELLTARISPGLLEAGVPLSPSDRETLLSMGRLSETIKNVIRSVSDEAESNMVRFPLTNQRSVHSIASLVTAKARLTQKLRKRGIRNGLPSQS